MKKFDVYKVHYLDWYCDHWQDKQMCVLVNHGDDGTKAIDFVRKFVSNELRYDPRYDSRDASINQRKFQLISLTRLQTEIMGEL